MLEQTLRSFRNRRIALFEPYADLSANPTLYCLVEELIEEGGTIDLFAPDNSIYPPIVGNITRYLFPRPFSLWNRWIHVPRRNWLKLEHFRNALRNLQQWKFQYTVEQMFSKTSYDLIFGIDGLGIIKGYEYAKQFNVPLVYISFEIFFLDELLSKLDIKEKKQEYRASRFANLIIIQDELRGKLLSYENNLPLDKFEYLPVSPKGPIRAIKSHYLRNRYKIPREKTIVLQAGHFNNRTCADELLKNVSTWPKDFVLVVHAGHKPDKEDPYIRKLKKFNLPNVFLSIEALSAEDYEELVASADIGLAFQKVIAGSRYTQKNIQNIGLSSGKFSFYLKCGLPVIALYQESYACLLEDYAFGEIIHSFSELPSALNRVQSNYDHHRTEAQRLYTEVLDFDVNWPRVLDRLLKILKS